MGVEDRGRRAGKQDHEIAVASIGSKVLPPVESMAERATEDSDICRMSADLNSALRTSRLCEGRNLLADHPATATSLRHGAARRPELAASADLRRNR